MPHTRTRDLQAEKGTLFWLCKEPELLPQFLDWGLTADCFSHASLQTFLLCLIECQGKGIVGARGIASQLQHHDGLGPKDLKKLQGWILNPPEPEIDPEQAVRTLTNLARFNKGKMVAYDFFDNIKAINYDQNVPGLVEFFLNQGSQATIRDATPLGILESYQKYGDFISTGYGNLDELLRWPGYAKGGLRKPWMVTITLPSKQGKTTVGCNLAVNMAKQGLGTVFFSLEMDRWRVFSWMVSNLALIHPSLVYEEERCRPEEKESRAEAIKILHDNVRIYDGQFTLSQIGTQIRAHQQEWGDKLFLVIIDRFELITEDKKYDRRGDWKQTDDMANAILRMSQQTKTCNVILNQMSTEAKKKWDVNMTLPSYALLRGGEGLFNSSDAIIAGGRHPGHEGAILMPEKQLCTVLHIKAVRDIGFDLGKVELKFVPEYKRLEEMNGQR